MAGDCKAGKEKNANGRCVKIKTCDDPNKEKNANGRCVLKCQSWQYRSSKSGRCLTTAKPKVSVTTKRAKRFQAADLALAKKNLKSVSTRGTRRLHTSKTKSKSKTPGFWADFKF
jgi:hypothetical protein